MCQELSGNISDFLMFHMILNGIIEINWINFSELHVVDTNTVVGKSLSMDVTDCPTYLQELLIKSNCFLEFSKVVIKYTSTVV